MKKHLLFSSTLSIDEVLALNSLRFLPFNRCESVKGQPSFDKQYLLDYLPFSCWEQKPSSLVLPV